MSDSRPARRPALSSRIKVRWSGIHDLSFQRGRPWPHALGIECRAAAATRCMDELTPPYETLPEPTKQRIADLRAVQRLEYRDTRAGEAPMTEGRARRSARRCDDSAGGRIRERPHSRSISPSQCRASSAIRTRRPHPVRRTHGACDPPGFVFPLPSGGRASVVI